MDKMKSGDKIRILITGITGSGASYLAEYLVKNHPELEVHGVARWHSTSTPKNLKDIQDKVTVHECDLTDFSAILTVLREVRPDYVFHLAAHANVHACFKNPLSVINNNVNNTINLFEALKFLELDPVIQFCGTSEVYGLVTEKDVPITEDQPLDPVNIYAVSKLTQEKIAMSYYHCYGMKVVVTRMFTYINPRRADIFSTSFARQVVDIEMGNSAKIVHGNLDSVRTLIDVRDAMESYWVASQKCEYGEVYNIGGTTTMTVGDFLELLKGTSFMDIHSEMDPELLRPKDVTLQIPDVSKFTNKTGWEPRFSMEESVSFLLSTIRRERGWHPPTD
jgi:GDP-4-dehydro-6-deoxy-D-mannose reductase